MMLQHVAGQALVRGSGRHSGAITSGLYLSLARTFWFMLTIMSKTLSPRRQTSKRHIQNTLLVWRGLHWRDQEVPRNLTQRKVEARSGSQPSHSTPGQKATQSIEVAPGFYITLSTPWSW